MSGTAGSAIRQMRTGMGLSQRDLARLAGVDASYLSAVERGRREASRNWLWTVSRALGEHLSYLAR